MLTSNELMCLAQGEVVSNHDELMSNFFAQADALALGKTPVELRSENVRPRSPLSRYCAVVSSVLLAAFHVALQWDRRCCLEGADALLSRLTHNRNGFTTESCGTPAASRQSGNAAAAA